MTARSLCKAFSPPRHFFHKNLIDYQFESRHLQQLRSAQVSAEPCSLWVRRGSLRTDQR
ncbi:hypothetical protein CSUI_006728 [Cystoisospora suis]|uniref:Uncharacterized protein n=1 Tax=Cystoisospora suis TaxID=483139 RepID=A0A2C6KSW9_9APIC|nr:hypothetical protein CSUI_006728 [Cystoisospora suis]